MIISVGIARVENLECDRTFGEFCAIDANNIKVTFDNEEVVEIELEEALVHGQTEVSFVYNEVEYTATLDEAYVDEDVAALETAKEEAIEELKAAGVTSEFYFDLINKGKTIEGVEALKNEILQTVSLQKAKETAKKAIDAVELETEGMTEESIEAAEAKLAELQEEAKKSVDALETIDEVKAYEFDASEAEDLLVTVKEQEAADLAEALRLAEEAIVALPAVEDVKVADKEEVEAAQALVAVVKELDADQAVEGEEVIAELEAKIDELIAEEAAAQAKAEATEAVEAVEAYEAKVATADAVVELVTDKELQKEVSEMFTETVNKVNILAEGDDKVALLDRVDQVHSLVTATGTVRAAQDAVVAATEELNEAKIDQAKLRVSNANTNVNLLTDGEAKDALRVLVDEESVKVEGLEEDLATLTEAIEAAEDTGLTGKGTLDVDGTEVAYDFTTEDAFFKRLNELEEGFMKVQRVYEDLLFDKNNEDGYEDLATVKSRFD